MGINWITASEIEAWTSREPRRAQELLPELVWRLLLASCGNMINHHFPHSKAVQYSGYDGYLDTDTQSVFFLLEDLFGNLALIKILYLNSIVITKNAPRTLME